METNQHTSPSEVAAVEPLDPIEQIARWFEIATPEPTERGTQTQIGIHLEEVFEMAKVLKEAGAGYTSREKLKFASDVLVFTQKQIKDDNISFDFARMDRVALLDALCDQIITAVGVAHMFGMDIRGALGEVAASNDSQFAGGRPVFNNVHKIIKSPHHRKPDLTPYVTRETRTDDREAE